MSNLAKNYTNEELNRIKYLILSVIKEKRTNVSFVELQDNIPNSYGDFGYPCVGNDGYLNILLWTCCSQVFIAAIKELLIEDRIVAKLTPITTYIIDGRWPQYPVANSFKKYKKEHWMPVVFNLM